MYIHIFINCKQYGGKVRTSGYLYKLPLTIPYRQSIHVDAKLSEIDVRMDQCNSESA